MQPVHMAKNIMLERYPDMMRFVILRVPGNNGDDGNCGKPLIPVIVTNQQPNKAF